MNRHVHGALSLLAELDSGDRLVSDLPFVGGIDSLGIALGYRWITLSPLTWSRHRTVSRTARGDQAIAAHRRAVALGIARLPHPSRLPGRRKR